MDVDALAELGQGQRVRLTVPDGDTIDLQVNQTEYAPGERLRLELTTDDSGDPSRYQATATADGGDWSPLSVRRYDPDRGEWESLGEVSAATRRGTFLTVRSDDMAAQERAGRGSQR
jgi:uncharacterized protein YndB with AHSA1/START domain